MNRISDELRLIEKYSRKEELEEYTKAVARGLRTDEQYIIFKYIKRGKVLDIGCGAGREAIALAKKGLEVVGIDIAPAVVLKAKENSKLYGVKAKTRFEVSDARGLDFGDESFDAVLMLENMIEHIAGRENRIGVLEGIKRVLKPNGTLVFSTHTRASSLRHRLYWAILNGLRTAKKELTGKYGGLELGDRYAKRVSAARSKGRVFIHIYTYEEALEDIKSAGMELVEAICSGEIEKGVQNIEVRKRARQVLYAVKKL